MQKLSIAMAMLLTSTASFAVNKCVIDGKTVYQAGRCLNGKAVPFEANVSGIGSEGLREEVAVRSGDIANMNSKHQQQAIQKLQQEAKLKPNNNTDFNDYGAVRAKAENAKQKLRDIGVRTKEDDLNEKIDNLQKSINRNNRIINQVGNDAAWARMRANQVPIGGR